jgi:phosphoglycerate dehydrogenase-like enzyme
MKIGINAGRQFWDVFSPEARARLSQWGAEPDLVPADRGITEDEVVEMVAGARAVVGTWGIQPFTKRVLDACPSLELVVYAAGSVKSFVTDELKDRGITVCGAAHINGIPVAQFVVGVILSELKGVIRSSRRLHEQGPSGWYRSKVDSPGYYKTTVGLIGFGKITRYLIELLRPFDVTILVEDPHLGAEQAASLGVIKKSVDEVMAESDVVSLHHADVPQNWGMITRERLRLIKPGGAFINTSRGRLVDEDALVDALRTQDLMAYIDVTYPEPPAAGHPFYSLPNCIVTPHIAGSFGREVERMGDWAVTQLAAWEAGQPLDGVVDLSTLDAIA